MSNVAIYCTSCGQRGAVPLGKVSSRLRCARCKSHALDIDDRTPTTRAPRSRKPRQSSRRVASYATPGYYVLRHGVPAEGPFNTASDAEAQLFTSGGDSVQFVAGPVKGGGVAQPFIDPSGYQSTAPLAPAPPRVMSRRKTAASVEDLSIDRNAEGAWRISAVIADDPSDPDSIGADYYETRVYYYYSKQEAIDSFLEEFGGRIVSEARRRKTAVSMTRQHFEHIADTIATAPLDESERYRLARSFAERLPSMNSGFKPSVFIDRAERGGGPKSRPGDIRDGASMTRGHYEFIADAIAWAFSDDPGKRQAVAEHFANRLGGTNSMFNRSKFVERASGDPAQRMSRRNTASRKRLAAQRKRAYRVWYVIDAEADEIIEDRAFDFPEDAEDFATRWLQRHPDADIYVGDGEEYGGSGEYDTYSDADPGL